MSRAGIVIGRAGYSTIMDILTLGKKSILIPTPGQPEQQYLAAYLRSKHFIYTGSQEGLSLKNLLEAVGTFDFDYPTPASRHALQEAIEGLANY